MAGKTEMPDAALPFLLQQIGDHISRRVRKNIIGALIEVVEQIEIKIVYLTFG